MKKIFFIISVLLISLSSFSQHELPFGARIGDTNAVWIDSVFIRNDSLIFVTVNGDEYALGGAEVPDSIDISLIVTLQSDTVPLVSFGGGGGQLGDTTFFTTDYIYGAFYNKGSDTLVITSLKGIIITGTGASKVDVQVSWHATFKSGSATKLNTSAYTIDNTLKGNEDVSFNNSEIPPGVWVWCSSPTIYPGKRPAYLSITMSGHKRNTAY